MTGIQQLKNNVTPTHSTADQFIRAASNDLRAMFKLLWDFSYVWGDQRRVHYTRPIRNIPSAQRSESSECYHGDFSMRIIVFM